MILDSSVVGRRSAPHSVDVERGRLRFFAEATGQDDPAYRDVEAARAAGHPDLPVPPTFLFCLEMDNPAPWGIVEVLGVDLRTILHAGQAFEYHAMAYAGDRLTFASEITDVYQKKGGALTFVSRTTEVTRDGGPVATMVSTLVLRTGGEAAG
jgi:acyl dehydratase